jgi:hypothetical protein
LTQLGLGQLSCVAVAKSVSAPVEAWRGRAAT